MNPELDLTLTRVIRAPRAVVWRAWTDPDRLAQWWLPAPAVTRVESLDVRPGGAFVTRMSDDGAAFAPHFDGLFLAVDEGERIVFTNAVDSALRPVDAAPVPMTAEIVFAEHPDGTEYRVLVRHRDPADRAEHERLGFLDGWGTVTAALAALAEAEAETAAEPEPAS
jgi:uncharacterized protein YndB with AHSA1/START domain